MNCIWKENSFSGVVSFIQTELTPEHKVYKVKIFYFVKNKKIEWYNVSYSIIE